MEGLGSQDGGLGRWRAVWPVRRAAPRVQVGGLPRLCGGVEATDVGIMAAPRKSIGVPWRSFVSDPICSDSCRRRPLAIALIVSWCWLDRSGGWACIQGKPLDDAAAFPN